MARGSPLKPQHNKAFLQEIVQFILTTVELLRTIIYGSYDDCVKTFLSSRNRDSLSIFLVDMISGHPLSWFV